MAVPLKCFMNRSQVDRSHLASWSRLMGRLGFWIPKVRAINLLRKYLPGVMTWHAKFSKPINDWISFKETDVLLIISLIVLWILSNLTWGTRATLDSESNSMPRKLMTVEGCTVFSALMGTPVCSHILKKLIRSV